MDPFLIPKQAIMASVDSTRNAFMGIPLPLHAPWAPTQIPIYSVKSSALHISIN